MAIFREQDSNLRGQKWSYIEFQVLNLLRHGNLVEWKWTKSKYIWSPDFKGFLMKTQFIDLVRFGGAHEGSRADYFPVFSLVIFK